MHIKKILSIDLMIDILLIFALFEKIQYSVFKLFDIISILFVLMVGFVFYKYKVIIRDNNIKLLIVAKVALLLLYVSQGILVSIDGRDEILDQYFKGMLTSGVKNTLFIVCAIIYISVYYKASIRQLLIKLAKIGSINIVYNLLQLFITNIDEIIFKGILHSSVSRYGTDAYGAGVGRLTGLFTDSNNNAAFLLLYFVVIYMLLKESTGKKRVFLIVLLLSCSLELILTYSRTGWLGFVFCVFLILLKEGFFQNTIFVIFIIIGIGLGLYFYQNSFVFHQVMTARLSGLNENNSHLEAARNVFEIVEQSIIYPLIGVGINCLSVHYEALFGRVGMKAHSLYLQVFCESGIIGLTLTLLFWGLLFYCSYKAYKVDEKVFGIPMIVATFLVINITYDSAFQPMFFWVLILAIVSYKEKVLDHINHFVHIDNYSVDII